MNKIIKYIVTTPQEFENSMQEANDGFFGALVNFLKMIFSSASLTFGLLAALSIITFLIFALINSERRKVFLFSAGGSLIILLLAVTTYVVFGK